MPAAHVGAQGWGWERGIDVVPVVPGDAKPGGTCSGLGPCGGDSRTRATCQHVAPARPWHGQGRSTASPQSPPQEYWRGGEGTGHAASQGRRAGGSRSHCRTGCSTPGQKQETERAWDRAQVSLLPLTAQGWGLQPRHPSRRGQERPQKWGLGSEHRQPSLAAFPSRGKWRPEGTSTACCGRDVSAPRILQRSGLSIKTNIKKT